MSRFLEDEEIATAVMHHPLAVLHALVMCDESVRAMIVGGLFAKLPELEQLVLEWVSILHFGGAEYRPGHSWLQATYDGRQILAFLPEQSVFRYNGRLYALLHLYPTAEREELCVLKIRDNM